MRLLLTIILLISLIPFVYSDGCMIPPANYFEDLFEPEQKAIILLHNNTEQLIIQPKFEGRVENFAWIIPVPSYPTVEEAAPELFFALHSLTKPEVRDAANIGSFGVGSAARIGDTVTVHENMEVGIFNITILSAKDPQDLQDWLQANEYQVPDNSYEIFKHYTDKEWFFIAKRINRNINADLLAYLQTIDSSIIDLEDAKTKLTDYYVNAIVNNISYNNLGVYKDLKFNYDIGTEVERRIFGSYSSYYNYYYSDSWLQGDKDGLEGIIQNIISQNIDSIKNDIENRMKSGQLSPVQISFTSDELVYPLYITRIQDQKSEVLLYTIADYKTHIPGFELEYADWFSPDKSETESLYPNDPRYGRSYAYRDYSHTLNKFVPKKMFITKHRAVVQPSEMNDLHIAQADNNEKHLKKVYGSGSFWGFVMSIFMSLFILPLVFGFFLLVRFLNNVIFKKESIWNVTVLKTLLLSIVPIAILIFMSVGGFIGYLMTTIIISSFAPLGIINGSGFLPVIGRLLLLILIGIAYFAFSQLIVTGIPYLIRYIKKSIQ